MFSTFFLGCGWGRDGMGRWIGMLFLNEFVVVVVVDGRREEGVEGIEIDDMKSRYGEMSKGVFHGGLRSWINLMMDGEVTG